MSTGTRTRKITFLLSSEIFFWSIQRRVSCPCEDDESYGLLIIPMGRDQKSACPCIMSAKEAKNSNNLRRENCALLECVSERERVHEYVWERVSVCVWERVCVCVCVCVCMSVFVSMFVRERVCICNMC